MDRKRYEEIMAKRRQHEERKKKLDLMSAVDESKFDTGNQNYNSYEAKFEAAKQHYQNSYVPKKAQEYYKGVENYRNSYSQVNKPSANNYNVMTPDNLIANNLADGMYIDSKTRNKVKERSNAVYNNENKKYAEQYARLNENAKTAYQNTRQTKEYDSKLNDSIDKYYSQFGNAEDYNNSRKQQILLNYDRDTAVKNAVASTDKVKDVYSDENDNGRYHVVLANGIDIPVFATQDEENEYLSSKANIHGTSTAKISMDMAKQILPQDFIDRMRNAQQANEVQRESDKYKNDPLYKIDVDNAIQKYNEQQTQAQKLSDYMRNQGWLGQVTSSTAEAFQKWGDDVWASVYGVIDALDFGAFGDNPQKAVEYFNDQATVKNIALEKYHNNKYGEAGGSVTNFVQKAIPDTAISLGMAYATGGVSLGAEAGIKITADMAKKEIAKAVATKAKTAILSALKNPNFYWTFIREGGSAYNDAIADGADDTQALIAMLGTGFTNSMIELGGGIEKIPENKGTIKDWLKEIASSFKEEGLEEVTQGIAGQLVAKAVYAPTMSWYSMADDGSGVFNPKRAWEEFIGGAMGGAMGGFVGGGINVATNKIVSNIYASDYMRYGIQTGDLDHIAEMYPDTEFAKEYTKLRELVVKDNSTKPLKKVSDSRLAKLANMAQPLINKYADAQAEALIAPYTQNVSEDRKKAVSSVVRKLLQGEEITIDEAKTATSINGTLSALSYVTGKDFTKISADELAQASKNGTFETLSAIDEGSETAKDLARTQRIYNATQSFLVEKQYNNDLSGTPTFTAQIGDESVKITGIDHVENGEVYVNLSNGTTQEAQSLNTDEVTTALLSYASEYDEKTASAFVGGYTGNISVGEYARSFAEINSAARTGLSYENITKIAPVMVENIGKNTAITITKTGNAYALEQAKADIANTAAAQQNQAMRNDNISIENKTGGTATREHRVLARTVSKVTGYTVVLVDSSNANNGKTVNGRKAIGEFNSTKGEIVLDIGSDNVVATALHEVTHYAKINAPTQYNALRDAVLEHTTKSGKMKYYLEKYSNTYRTNNVYEITEEMTADAAEALLTNEKFIDELFNDKDFINAVVGENKGFVRKFLDTLHDIINSIKDYLKGRTVNHQIARELSEDVKALEKIEKLWRDALKAAVDNHAKMTGVKENTDTESSGGVKYSKAEKNALTKEEYKRATAAFMNGDTSAIIEDCAIRVTNKNDVYKIKIVCYNLSDDGFDFQITEVYQIENYDYNIHSENEDPAVIIAKGVRDGYTQREIEALLQNNKFDDGQIFKRFSPQSGRYYRLKKSTGRGERVSGGKSSGSGLSEETEQSETESKLKFSLSEPVEEKNDLIAVHNIYANNISKSLKLGGFPMPSIAVIKADMGHGRFGDCSFVFDKSTIDPKVDRENKVYGGDAWTPTYPAIEYKASEDVIQRVKDKYEEIKNKTDEDISEFFRWSSALADILNSVGGEQTLLNRLYNNTAMMQVYRIDKGKSVIENVTDGEEWQAIKEQNYDFPEDYISMLATDKAIRDSVNQSDYRKWIDGLFKGIEEKKGFANSDDLNANNSNFDAYHYEETLENAVKVMRSNVNGDATIWGGMGIWGVSQKEYSSIDTMKSDSARLQKISDDEYSNIKRGFAEQLSEVTKAIKNDYSGNDFIDSDIVAGNIVDAVRESKTKSGIKSYLKEYYPDITDTAVDDIVNLVHGIMEMPTGYFEAKPQRAVRFDEVKYAVVPETLDENIKKQLADYGIQIIEYEDGNEEDRTAKLNSLDDVKFSISEQTTAEYEMLKQENSDLKAQVEALKKEMELTGGHTVDSKTVNKLARRYVREYKSKADVAEVSAKLKRIFDYVATEDANAEEANKAMYELASQMINKSETLNTEMRDTYKDVLDTIRKSKIYVDDTTKSEIEYLYGDYNTFRKSMFGRMKLTTNRESHGQTVDMLVQELAELAPGQFETNVSEGDALEQLVDFIEATKPRVENSFGDSVAEAASDLAAQMFDDYFDIPEIKTFADKYEAKLQKVINDNRKTRAELRKNERAKAKAFYDAKLKALRDAKNQKLSDVRVDRDTKLKALRERYREQQEDRRRRATENDLRAKITVEYKKLYKDLTSNSKEHHIPEIYKDTVANVLASIDLVSKASKNKEAKTGELTKAAEKLNNQLTELENFIFNHSMYGSKDEGTNSEQLYNFDPDLASNIEKLKEYYKNYAQSGTKAVSDMNVEELRALHDTLKALRYAVKTADKALSANITQRITELAESSISEMATDKTRNPFNKNKAMEAVGALDTYINSQMLDARSYYRGMGDSATEIYKAFRSGLNTYISHIHEIQDYFAKVRKECGLSEKQFKRLSTEYVTYEVSHGKITMSKAQLMSLYCLSKREQALEHIFKGGIRPTDLKGKRQVRPTFVSPEEVAELCKNLNSTELAMANKLQQFMATTCAKWGNEVSMAMYGYAKFTDKNYFPIKSSDTKLRTNDQNSGGDTGLYSVLNYGMTKSLVKNANNSIDIGDIFDVTRQHVEEMSSYSAYAGAVADGMRWFNYNNRETGESIKQSMLNKFGTNGSKYFIELVRDINRNKPTGNYGGEISSILTSAQKAAAIAGNLSVVIQQPTAIARACSELTPDLIAKGIAKATSHPIKSAEEAQTHSEIAWWKSQGFFETNMGKSMDAIITGRSTAKDKLVELTMKPAGIVDDITWGAIWEASKLWTKKFHSEVEIGSDEFFNITKEKFDDVVDQTQVVDSVLHRPMILRSKNALVKMDMSFMAEPLKSANLLRNAIVDVKNKKPNATKRLIRVYVSCVMANVLAAAAKAIVMAFRDTGDDDWLEKWLESFTGDLLSTLNPVSIIPFVKDIFTLLDGYDVERMDMSAISGLIKFGQQMVVSAQNGTLDTSLNLQSVYKLTRYLSQLTGVPVYNVLREVDTIVDIFGEPIFRASQATPDTERYEALYNAVMKNDEAEMQNEYDRLGKTQKEVEQRLKSKIIDDSKGNKMFNEDVDKAAKARINGDVKTAVEIVRNLADTTALSKDFWTACVNARVNKISKAQGNRTLLIESGISKLTVDNMSDTEVNEALKSYETEADTSTASDLNEDTNTESLYTADDLVKALQNGNESDYNTAYDDMVSTKAVSLIMQAEADNKELTADEAEEKAKNSVKSAVTKVLKPQMRELYKSDKKKFNEMKKRIIKKFGYSFKQISKWLTE